MEDRLSTKENFVLFVIQRSNEGLASNDVMRRTSLSLAEVEHALRELSALRLIEGIEQAGITYYEPRRLTTSPLLPDFEGWLRNFCSFHPQWVDEDQEATTFGSCGVVILAALLSGSREAETLVMITGLSEAFVLVILALVEHLDLWWSKRILDLEQTLLHHAMNYAVVDSAFHGIKEEFWNALEPGIGNVLTPLRAGQHSGSRIDGGIQ
jgi:hypothetical protein